MSVDFLIKLSTRGAGHTLGLSSAQPSAKTRTSKSRFLKTSYIPRTSLLTASPVVMLGVRMAILVITSVNRFSGGFCPPLRFSLNCQALAGISFRCCPWQSVSRTGAGLRFPWHSSLFHRLLPGELIQPLDGSCDPGARSLPPLLFRESRQNRTRQSELSWPSLRPAANKILHACWQRQKRLPEG